MNPTPTLPGFRVPTPEEEFDASMKRAVDVVVTEYGGSMEAFFKKYFAEKKAAEDLAARKYWSEVQQKILQRQAQRLSMGNVSGCN